MSSECLRFCNHMEPTCGAIRWNRDYRAGAGICRLVLGDMLFWEGQMTSEERVSKFLSEPIRVEDFHTALVNLLDAHAEEQRQECADAVIVELKSIGFQIHESGEDRIRDACIGATGESDGKNT